VDEVRLRAGNHAHLPVRPEASHLDGIEVTDVVGKPRGGLLAWDRDAGLRECASLVAERHRDPLKALVTDGLRPLDPLDDGQRDAGEVGQRFLLPLPQPANGPRHHRHQFDGRHHGYPLRRRFHCRQALDQLLRPHDDLLSTP